MTAGYAGNLDGVTWQQLIDSLNVSKRDVGSEDTWSPNGAGFVADSPYLKDGQTNLVLGSAINPSQDNEGNSIMPQDWKGYDLDSLVTKQANPASDPRSHGYFGTDTDYSTKYIKNSDGSVGMYNEEHAPNWFDKIAPFVPIMAAAAGAAAGGSGAGAEGASGAESGMGASEGSVGGLDFEGLGMNPGSNLSQISGFSPASALSSLPYKDLTKLAQGLLKTGSAAGAVGSGSGSSGFGSGNQLQNATPGISQSPNIVQQQQSNPITQMAAMQQPNFNFNDYQPITSTESSDSQIGKIAKLLKAR